MFDKINLSKTGSIIKMFLVKAYLNPIIFLIFIFSWIWNFIKIEANITRFDIISYLFFWAIIYYIAIFFQAKLLKKTIEQIIYLPNSIWEFISYFFIFITLFFWIFFGMEGNVFGFIFSLPIMIFACYFLVKEIQLLIVNLKIWTKLSPSFILFIFFIIIYALFKIFI
jgi:hypothetical protein